MATSASFSLSCISQSTLLSKHKSHSPSPAASLLSPQFVHKALYCHPLTQNRVSVSPIGINPKRSSNVGLTVKASLDNKNLEVFSKENLSVSLAKYISDLSSKFIKERGYFTIVLSGGGSIKHLRNLVEAPYLTSTEWSKWHVFWADERVVPKNHLDSNYKLAYDRFISKVPIPIPRNVNTIDDALSAEGAADVYESNIKLKIVSNVVASTNGFPKFDLMLLDTGADGHVASLFPGHPALNETRKWVATVKNAPQPPPQRITLTLPVINASSNIAMVVTGIGKADVVNSALKGDQIGGDKLPVQLVSPEGELKWFLDKDAASKLYN